LGKGKMLDVGVALLLPFLGSNKTLFIILKKRKSKTNACIFRFAIANAMVSGWIRELQSINKRGSPLVQI
jgi:hypothetical protein